MSYRVSRVEEVMRREVGMVISRDFEFGDSIIMINHISMTPDLKQCHIYIGITGSTHNKKRTFEFLQKNAKKIQQKVSARIVLKNTPQIIFKLDNSTSDRIGIVNLIDELDIPDHEDQENTTNSID